MADSENTTKEQASQAPEDLQDNSEELDGDVLSLESLDAILAEEDPEFLKSLQTIGPDNPNHNKIYEEGVELEYEYAEEKLLWQNATGIRKFVKNIFPFLPYLNYLWKINSARVRLWRIKKVGQLKYFLIHAGPRLKSNSLKTKTNFQNSLSLGIKTFKAYSWARKISFVFLVTATIGGTIGIQQLLSKNVFKPSEALFMTSLGGWAQTAIPYSQDTVWEPFYSSTRIVQNVFLMQKMVVNLKRSENSESNPMGAFEFFVEGTVNDVIVEIKDREPEIEDLFLRTIEEMNYDQIASGDGKKNLCEVLRRQLNKVLTKGQVRRIYFKTAIVKP